MEKEDYYEFTVKKSSNIRVGVAGVIFMFFFVHLFFISLASLVVFLELIKWPDGSAGFSG